MIKVNLFVFVILFLSCGKEIEKQRLAEAQKVREDSIRLAVENETRIKIERKNALQDSVKNGELTLTSFRNRLIFTTGELEAAKDKLEGIKGFQFLRTDAERAQQIKDQTVFIMSLQNGLSTIQENIILKQRKLEDWKQELLQFE